MAGGCILEERRVETEHGSGDEMRERRGKTGRKAREKMRRGEDEKGEERSRRRGEYKRRFGGEGI